MSDVDGDDGADSVKFARISSFLKKIHQVSRSDGSCVLNCLVLACFLLFADLLFLHLAAFFIVF